MDNFTQRHMTRWIEQQFGTYDDVAEIAARMSATYQLDPEFYDGAGWWRCYDDSELIN